MYLGSCQLDAAYLGSCKLDKIYLGMCEVLSGVTVLPVFRANYANPDTGLMDALAVGVGTATNARTYDLEVRDFDDTYRTVPGGVVAYDGARYACNAFFPSGNISSAPWTLLGTATTPDASTLNTPAINDGIYSVFYGTVGKPYDFIISVVLSGSGTIAIDVRDDDLTINRLIYETVTLTATPTRYSFIGSSAALISGAIYFYIGRYSGMTATTTYVDHVQVEDVLTSGQTVCSERVTTTTGPSSVAFGTTNGNSVDANGIVTEARGADLPVVPRAVSAPQATNLSENNGDLSLWVKYNVTTPDSDIGIDGLQTATVCTTPGDGTPSFVVDDGPAAVFNNPVYCVVFIKKDVSASYGAYIRIFSSGSPNINAGFMLNVADGSYTKLNITNEAVELIGDYWRVSFKTPTPVGSTYLNYRLHPHCVNHSTFAIDVTKPGSSTFTRAQLYLNVDANTFNDLPPIYTESAAVTRDADGISYDSANHSDIEGTYLIEAQFGTNGQGIFSDFLRVISTNVRLNDGSNFADVTGAIDTPHKIGIVYGGGTMRLNVDGVWSAVTTYDGTLPDGVLDLFRSSTGVNFAGRISRYDVSDEAIVDEWMVS